MHRFPNKSVIIRFRMAAFFFILRCACLTIGVPMLIISMVLHEERIFLLAVGMLALLPLILLAQWILASGARCPLCFGQPMLHRNCVKNRKAGRLFGSYRLRVACQLLLFGNFRCQYCGEPAQMKPRLRR